MPQFISVGSSWIDSYAYDSGDLYVRFNDGALCYYESVPLSIWEGLLGSSSKGKYFHRSGLYTWPYKLI